MLLADLNPIHVSDRCKKGDLKLRRGLLRLGVGSLLLDALDPNDFVFSVSELPRSTSSETGSSGGGILAPFKLKSSF